jgi:hypothetical protein
VNGSFEEIRGDGSPFGWRKQGGEITSVREPKTDGLRSVALRSQTSSTKWVYQTVSVVSGSYYQASVDAYAGDGTEVAFLRVSWYASADGSGPAISSVDSLDSASPAGTGYRRLSTQPVEAPPESASAKLRLMLRPQSDQLAVAYFDAASFSPVEPGAREVVIGLTRGRSGNVGAPGSGDSAGAPPANPSRVAPPRTPIRLANVKPFTTPGAISAPLTGGGGQENWAILLAVGIAVAAIASAGGHELWQSRIRRDGARTLSDD